jgi:hypothetical protein
VPGKRLSSPRFRRRLLKIGVPVAVLATVVAGAVLWGNTGPDAYRKPTAVKGGGSTAAPALPRHVPLTNDRRQAALATARKFLLTAVSREHVEDSWPLVHPTLRQGMTRREWATGDIPIVPYPVDVARWRLGYSNAEGVGFEVLLLPDAGSEVRPQVFEIVLEELGAGDRRRWLVSAWAPRTTGLDQQPPPLSPERQSTAERILAERERDRLGVVWLLAPVTLIIGIILVLPAFLLGRDWRRRRRADRSYREHGGGS